MKSYELWLHYKQGDDFRGRLNGDETGTAKALKKSAQDFSNMSKVCEALAKALTGFKVNTQADTHVILFEPQDKESEQKLESLAKEGYIVAFDHFDEEC